jgi:lipoprotein-anchoring transpeptidase ErfK/SrfK
MSKYDEVIGRAVAAMPRDIAERHATYNRARSALIERLRSVTPPLPEVAIEAEQAALEAAIQRVEAQFSVPADEVFDPPPAHRLDEPRYGLRIAMIGGAVVAVVLLAGFFTYPYWSSVARTAFRQLRPPAVQHVERAGPDAKVADAPSTEPVPYVYRRQLVHYRSTNPAGTLVIDKAQRHLYVILANVTAIRYGIGLGGNCVEAVGRYAVSRKAGTSDSPQPSSVRSDSSSGRALYLDSDTRLIHGAGVARAIGQTVRVGCFLLMPTDLAELYDRVPVGTRVVVN